MKKSLIAITAILSTVFNAGVQDMVTGKVVDKKGNPIPGDKV